VSCLGGVTLPTTGLAAGPRAGALPGWIPPVPEGGGIPAELAIRRTIKASVSRL
jgi:hypothetical protein